MNNPQMARYSEAAIGDTPYDGWSSSQMYKFSRAIMAYIKGEVPEEYAGDSMKSLAEEVFDDVGPGLPTWHYGLFAMHRIIARQKDELKVFGVSFDSWSHECGLLDPYTFRLRIAGLMGLIHMTGRGGTPVCINCAHAIVPNTPCGFCVGAGFYGTIDNNGIQ